MNAYEFGLLLGGNEKAAAGFAGVGTKILGMADDAAKGFGKATAKLRQQGGQVLRQQATEAAKLPKAAPGWLQRGANVAGDEALTSLDNLGKFTRRQGRNAATAVKNWWNPPTSTQAVPRLTYNNPNSRALIPYKAPESRALIPYTGQMIQHPGRTWKDIGTGAGALGLGAAGLTAVNPFRGGEPSAANINAQQTNTQLAQGQHMEAAPNSGGLMGMWNSLPVEARYAIGAGVPLALAGAFMGGNGHAGLGAGMGALGLGAAGLGAAGAGMFGDGPRRLVGQGAHALYNMVGGGGGNPMDQINALGQLSPEFGTTMLMGRDPNMSSGQARQMYDFLTHNRNIIEQLMPQLQNASVNGMKQGSAVNFGEKIARCWKGYEPVPGKKPYSNDSCRPVGSKKKKEKKAVSSAPRGTTEMTCTPSSRGTSKPIDDKQRETNSPVPTGAGNVQQANEKVSAPLFEKMDLVQRGATKTKAQVKKKLPPVNLHPRAADDEKEAALGGAIAGGLGRVARGVSRGAGTATRFVGNMAAQGGGQLANKSMQMAQRGLQQGGVRGAVNTALGAAGTAVGGGLNVAGRAAQGAGQVAQWAGKQVPGSRMMNAARTAVAVPTALGVGYGAYQATKPITQPYTNAAYDFGANVANTAGQQAQQAGQALAAVPGAIGQGFHNTGSAIGDAVGTAYGNTRNTVVNTARDVRRGVNNAAQAVAAVPQAIGQGIHDTGAAMGDAVGTAYGNARNAVVNTANDVRRGVNNTVQTARTYIPSVRNPFYYQ